MWEWPVGAPSVDVTADGQSKDNAKWRKAAEATGRKDRKLSFEISAGGVPTSNNSKQVEYSIAKKNSVTENGTIYVGQSLKKVNKHAHGMVLSGALMPAPHGPTAVDEEKQKSPSSKIMKRNSMPVPHYGPTAIGEAMQQKEASGPLMKREKKRSSSEVKKATGDERQEKEAVKPVLKIMKNNSQDEKHPMDDGSQKKKQKVAFSPVAAKEKGTKPGKKRSLAERLLETVQREETVTPSGVQVVKGGELENEIAASELDACLGPLLEERYVSALRYYHALLAGSKEAASTFLEEMDRIALEHGWVIFPMIVRRHWITMVISRTNDKETRAVVYDSSPHPVVHGDVVKFYRLAGEKFAKKTPALVCVVRQLKDSNDCGLHVIFIALWKFLSSDTGTQPQLPEPGNQPRPLPEVSLTAWRAILKDAQCDIRSPRVLKNLLSEVPSHYFPGYHSDDVQGGAQPKESIDRHGHTLLAFTPTCPGRGPDPVRKSGDARRVVINIDDVVPSDADRQRVRDEQIELFPVPWKKLTDLVTRERIPYPEKVVDGILLWRKSLEYDLGDKSAVEVSARLRDAPAALRNNGTFMAKARKLTDGLLNEQGDAIRVEPACAEKFDRWRRGVELTDTLVDHMTALIPTAMVEARLPYDWSIIPSANFASFIRSNSLRQIPALGTKVACIVHQPLFQHFVTFIFDGSVDPPRLDVYDSVFNSCAHRVRKETSDQMWHFVNLLNSAGVQRVPKLAIVRWCPSQQPNDCGIESVNNLIRATTGRKGMFSRDQIRRAYIHHTNQQPGPFIFDLLGIDPTRPPQHTAANTAVDNVNPQKPPKPTSTALPLPPQTVESRVKKPAQRMQHQPYAVSALEPVLQTATDVRVDRALTHAEVRTSARNMKCGAEIIIQCRTQGKDVMKLAATIEEVPSLKERNGAGMMTISHFFCRDCKGWHPTVGWKLLPDPQTNYIEFRPLVADEVRLHTKGNCREEDEFDGEDDGEFSYDVPATKQDIAKFSETYRVVVETEGPQSKGASEVESLAEVVSSKEYKNELQRILVQSKCPVPDLPVSSPNQIQAAVVLDWHILDKKPLHIHAIVWNKLASSTRKGHRRRLKELQGFVRSSRDKNASLAHAVVQMVMKLATERQWAWSTISSTLSTINSALRSLQCYVDKQNELHLDKEYYFGQALAHAQKLAKTSAVGLRGTTPLSAADFKKLANQLKGRAGWALFQLTWFSAGRIGDIRRVKKKDISIDLDVVEHGSCPVKILFTEGKGATFCGPYTIFTRIPKPVAKAIFEAIRERQDEEYLFEPRVQRQVSLAIGALPDHSVRSIRRGALVHLANCGVTDHHLQLLSGHKRMDTLMRYLDWGGSSSEAATAAKERARLLQAANPRGGGEQLNLRPMCMGYHSGYNGDKGGKRTKKPHRSIFELKPADDRTLGNCRERLDVSAWPLHAKMDLGTVDYDKLVRMADSPDLRTALLCGRSWLEKPDHYGVSWAPLKSTDVPYSSFTPEHIRTMIEAKKITPLPEGVDIRAMVKGFPSPQVNKQRLRPVFECQFNPVIDHAALPPLTYPSRKERRAALVGKRFRAEFDFSAWFDQIVLNEEVQPFYVLRVKSPVEVGGRVCDKFMLTRLPMGGSHAAHVAQTTTWSIIEPIIKMEGVICPTMLDNVCIASNDESSFVQAVQCFLQRCEQVGATLNDQSEIPRSYNEIAAWGLRGSREPFIFLGEEYVDGRVKNTHKNVEKLRIAWVRLNTALEARNEIITRRNLAAIIGLIIWMSNTVDIGMHNHFELIRTLSRVEATQGSWDAAVEISAALIRHFAPIVQALLENRPIDVTLSPLPSHQHQDYDAIVVVDASATGFGGYALVREDSMTTKVIRFCHGFSTMMRHSAWAEPYGATEVLRWIRKTYNARYVAVITDHSAMPLRQRRPLSGHGGFSMSYYLNRFFSELYDCGGGQVFFVPGVDNIGDRPSRETRIGQNWTCHDVTASQIFPSLLEFKHQYAKKEERPWWNV